MSDVIAIAVADIHLSHTVPSARSAESDWYEAMARPLWELGNLAEELNAPILCAGDIFHKWGGNSELINFAIKNLPKMLCIPGQHDLPYHDYDLLDRTAYHILMEAGIIEDLGCGEMDFADFDVHSFPFGFDVSSFDKNRLRIQIAVIHSYIWTSSCKYPGAPIQANLTSWKSRLKGYNVAVFGDNHKGFLAKAGKCNVINCGSLIRRNIDQKDYKPSVGLIHSDGSITQHFLDCSQDVWADDESQLESNEEKNPEMEKFLEELEKLEYDSIDFRESVRRYVDDNVSDDLVRKLIVKILDEC